jgi:hypothetical protein
MKAIKQAAAIVAGIMAVEAQNDQFRQPNPNGRYPLCKPIVGDSASRCTRCGGYSGYHRPCPAVLPEQRWGSDYQPERVGR